jgi:hypothetical protein
MNRIFSILVCGSLLFFGTGHAQPLPTAIRQVAPGVLHKSYSLPGPWSLDVLEVSMPDSYCRLESYRPGKLVRTSAQAAANDSTGHRVIAAINADFFSFQTQWPVGNQVARGTFVLGLESRRSHLAVDNTMHPFIEQLVFRGTVRARGGEQHALSGVNTHRKPGELVFYTPYKGSTSDSAGVDCSIRILRPPLAGNWTIGVVTACKASGSIPLPNDGGVLSGGPGEAASFLTSHCSVGDTISLLLGFEKPLTNITEVLGGAGRILRGGEKVPDSLNGKEGIKTTFTGVRHPRTFFGFNKDTTILYLCTVDGRQKTSLGMTFDEMGTFLQSIGVWDAFNFDGGGSTTMVVRGEIANSPSDSTGERPVANTLQVINVAPVDVASFSVTWQPPVARIRWSVNDETGGNRYVVERNTGAGFAAIGERLSGAHATKASDYEYLDRPDGKEKTSYRLRAITRDGTRIVTLPVVLSTEPAPH